MDGGYGDEMLSCSQWKMRCKEISSISSGRTRTDTSAGLSFYSKFGGAIVPELGRDAVVGDLPCISFCRSRIDTTVELSLYSKLDGITASKLSQDATVSGDPKAYQGTEDN